MDSATIVLLLSSLTAGCASLVTWLIARRTSGGRIDTSEANLLWSEGKQMRVELHTEVSQLKNEVIRIQVEALQLRQEAVDMRSELVVLRAETVTLRKELVIAHEEISVLQARIKSTKG